MKKKVLSILMSISVTAILLSGCGSSPDNASETKIESHNETVTTTEAVTTTKAESSEDSHGLNITSDISELAAMPAYGANPEYTIWTTVPYLVQDAQMQFTATISSNEDLKTFEIQCNFFEDQVAKIEYVDDVLTVTEDKTGFMGGFSAEIVQYAIDQNIWLSTADCPAKYGVFSDPGDEPVAANYVEDNRPLYIQAGVWEKDFERSNENLNNLATEIKDEKFLAYKQPCDHKGTVSAFEYDTYYYAKDLEYGDALSHATPITKTAYVYLPAGYDASKEYNILYLLHGGGDTAAKWFSQNDTGDGEVGTGYAVNILDNIFANGDAEPFIVITPGLYNDGDEGTQELNGYTETFRYELYDLMRVAEANYSTYAQDITDDSLIASRDHRAFAGLSMGSITTWHSAVANCIDVVSWFGNMSGGPSADVTEAVDFTTNTIIPAIEAAAENGYNINMLLSMNGVNDIALTPHVEAHKLLVDFANNNDALNVGDNYDFIVSNGAHTFEAWNLYLYDMAKVFFK